ncbi:MAG: hemolysin family protein, partial [Pseudomonadota bacterium]
VRAYIAEATAAGAVEPAERSMIERVMRLGGRPIRAVMTHRLEVEWIDLDASEAERRATLLGCRHSRLPVARGDINAVFGILRTKDVLDACLEERAVPWEALIRPVPVVHENVDLLDAIEILKAAKAHMALVVDEYGTFEGLLTTTDILTAIAGRFRATESGAGRHAVKRADGSWLIDGAMTIDEMADALGVAAPRPRDYETVAGLALAELRHLPQVGEAFHWQGWRFEVVDMDGRRIDRLLAAKLEG